MNSTLCTPRSWFVMIGRNSRSMNSVKISVVCSAALEWASFGNLGCIKMLGHLYCCCDLDSCSNLLSFESEQLLLKLNHHLLHRRYRSCSGWGSTSAPPAFHRTQDLHASVVQQSPSRRFPGPPDSFSAELSRPADTTQPRIRATTLGTQCYHGTATMMKYYDFVWQYAVNLFLEPLRSVRICEWLSEDENRYYTWSGLWTEGKCACMYSVHDRVTVDNMSVFGHSSSRAGCTFSMQDSRVKRGSTTGHKTQQARLPADSGLYNSMFPSLVNCIFPECQSDHHGSCTSTARSRQSVCSLYHPRASLGS